MKRLAVVTTHPIQYNAPWFKLLTQRRKIDVKIFYTWSQTEQGPKYDPDFRRTVEWDVPLLEGYDYRFVKNVSKNPGSNHFRGIDNPSLSAEIESWQADAVLVMGWPFKSHLACLRYFKKKIPVLFRGDSTLLDETKGVKKFLRRVFLTWVYRHVDKALYVGKHNKAYYIAHGLREEQLSLARHTVDNDRFSVLKPEHQEALNRLRNESSVRPSDFVVLFAGKLEEKKNPFFLLRLAEKLDDPLISFLLVGNGPLEETLKSAASADKRIKFLPFQNQSAMPAVYALGSVFLLPSKGPGETWGLAANEAMAAGLPVILSHKTGGAVDLVKENGIIFESGDVDAVAEYIQSLKENASMLSAAKAASRSHIQNFSFTQLTEAVEKACGV